MSGEDPNILTITSVFSAIFISIAGLAITLWHNGRKKTKKEGFDEGWLKQKLKHLDEQIEDLEDALTAIEKILENKDVEHDSFQKQISDIRVDVGIVKDRTENKK